MNHSDSTRCTDQVYEETDRIFGMIDQLQSKAAVIAAKELFDKGLRFPWKPLEVISDWMPPTYRRSNLGKI